MSALTTSPASELAKLSQDSEYKNMLFPLSRTRWTNYHREQRIDLITKLGGTHLKLITGDKRKIDAVWIKNEPGTSKSVILFHGNGTVLDGMGQHAYYFRKKFLNVLMITMGGYPGSQGRTTELTLYHDVAVAVRFLRQKVNAEPKDLLAVGYSLGSSLAMQAGARYGTHVLLDRTFSHLTHDLPKKFGWLVRKIAKVEKKINDTFPSDLSDGVYLTDGLNNISKAEKLAKKKGKLFVIYAKNDDVIPSPKKAASAIVKSYHAHSESEDATIVAVRGEHVTGVFLEQPEAVAKVDTFVKQIFG